MPLAAPAPAPAAATTATNGHAPAPAAHTHAGHGAGPSATLKVPLNLKAVKAALQNKPQAEEKAAATAAVAEELALPATNKAFSEDQLQQAWQSFFVQLKAQGGSPIEMMLAASGLELQNTNEVMVLLSSSLQEEPFDRLKPKIQHYLRQQLQNGQINLQHRLAEESGPRRLYTNNEKFQHLMQRYPLLAELKDRLGLEADF